MTVEDQLQLYRDSVYKMKQYQDILLENGVEIKILDEEITDTKAQLDKVISDINSESQKLLSQTETNKDSKVPLKDTKTTKAAEK